MTKSAYRVSRPCIVPRRIEPELLSVLRWLWVSFYSPQGPLIFPYVHPLLYVSGYLHESAFI